MKRFTWNVVCMPRTGTLALGAGLVLTLAACSAPRKIDPDFVASRWSTTLSAFNIDPIFLPRQVHLGDVYLAGELEGDPGADAKRWKRRTLYLGRAAVREAVLDDTRSRLRLPPTSVAAPSEDVFQAPERTTVLRPVAFPGFNVSEIRESDFAAALPIKLFRTLFGASKTGELVMSMSVPKAEYEEVPALAAWERFGEFCWKKGEDPVCAASNPVLQQLFNSLKLPSDTARLVPKVGIVTSVYYARQIDYFYNTGRASGFGASASLMPAAAQASDAGKAPATAGDDPATAKSASAGGAGASKESPPAADGTEGVADKPAGDQPAGGAKPKEGAASVTASAETAALHARVEAMQKRIDELQKQSGSADKYGAIRVISSTREGTVLSQTFERPVAIGYRAIWIYPLGYDPKAAIIQRTRQ